MLQKTLVLLPLHDAGDYMILVCDNQIHVLCETPQKHKDKSRENLDEIKKKVKECSFCGNDNDRGNICVLDWLNARLQIKIQMASQGQTCRR